jgi:hypothetical protein
VVLSVGPENVSSKESSMNWQLPLESSSSAWLFSVPAFMAL